MTKRHSKNKTVTANDLTEDQVQHIHRKLAISTGVILLLWGIYQSVNYFAHQVVPNPDFTGFLSVARRVLSFEMPVGSKRAPLLGIMQILFGKLTPTQHPDLTGAWLLNAVLHPLNILLLWLVARRLIGKAGLWVTIIAVINPMTIYLLTEPLAETSLLFFTLLTFLLMFRRSKWCYLTAALASMVRYEGAALILAAFVLDIAYAKDKKQRLLSLLYAGLASLPLILWVIGTAPDSSSGSSGHYLQLINPERFKDTLPRLWSLWNVTFSAFGNINDYFDNALTRTLLLILKSMTWLTVLISLVYSIMKKRWEMIAMFIFFVLYMIVHITYEFSTPRFYASVHWMLLIFVIDGFAIIYTMLNKKISTIFPVLLSIGGLIVCSLLLLSMFPLLEILKQASPASTFFPFAAFIVVITTLLCRIFITRERIFPCIVILSAMFMSITANQIYLASLLGHGTRSIEFKYLADWFLQNAPEDKKLVTTMSNVVEIFIPERKKDVLSTANIPGDGVKGFAEACLKRKPVYVAWDSRSGMIKNINYIQWRLDRIAPLNRTEDFGPYKFVTRFDNPHNQSQYINLFELRSD